jgi:general nucleoside transport system permease protein
MFNIRLSKNDNMAFGKKMLCRVLGMVLALIVCAIVIVSITKQNPLEIYGGILKGAFGSRRRIWSTVRDTLVLLLVAIGLVPAFKMKFWNIGAEGQMLMGGLASALLMIYCKGIPNGILLPMIVVLSALFGMIWAIIPAYFKAKFNTNETLFTLMLNYVAMQIISFCITFWEKPVGSNTVGIINMDTHAGWFPELFGRGSFGFNVIFVLIIAVAVTFYIKYTKHGYELTVVGESWDTAIYAGINVKKVIIRTMALSGAICGLAGCLVVAGASHTISTTLSDGRGFTAIIVAWMSNFNMGAMTGISLLLCTMESGAVQIASQFGLNENVSDIITGILLFFLIGSEFFTRYRINFQKETKREAQ